MTEPKSALTNEQIEQIRKAGEDAMRQEITRILDADQQPEKIDDVFSRSPGGGPGWNPPATKEK